MLFRQAFGVPPDGRPGGIGIFGGTGIFGGIVFFGDKPPGLPQAVVDLLVGRPETGEFHQVGGQYREVEPNKRLVFSWAWHSTPERESLVTITMKAEGDHTLLTLLHEQLFDEATKIGHTRGWTGSMDKLEAMFT